MLPLKIRCRNCSNSGELKDKSRFSYIGKYEGYSESECLICGRRLAYKIPFVRRYGLMAVGLLIRGQGDKRHRLKKDGPGLRWHGTL